MRPSAPHRLPAERDLVWCSCHPCPSPGCDLSSPHLSRRGSLVQAIHKDRYSYPTSMVRACQWSAGFSLYCLNRLRLFTHNVNKGCGSFHILSLKRKKFSNSCFESAHYRYIKQSHHISLRCTRLSNPDCPPIRIRKIFARAKLSPKNA